MNRTGRMHFWLFTVAFLILASSGAEACRKCVGASECSCGTARGVEGVVTTAHFKVHYCLSRCAEGGAATQGYATAIADIAEEVFSAETSAPPGGLGFDIPPSDDFLSDGSINADNGDNPTLTGPLRHFNKIDVIVISPSGTDGSLAQAKEDDQAPNGRFFGHIEIVPIPDCTSASGPPCAILKPVLAHEFNHLVQFGYRDVNPESHWLFEATAAWVQELVYPGLDPRLYDNNAGGLGVIFSKPEKSLDSVSRCTVQPCEDPGNEYGAWVWLTYLSQRFGLETIREIWNKYSNIPPRPVTPALTQLEAVDAVLSLRGSSLQDAFADFTGKLYTKQMLGNPDRFRNVIVRIPTIENTYPIVANSPLILDHLARSYIRFVTPNPSVPEKRLRILLDRPAIASAGVIISETADSRAADRRMVSNAAGVDQFGAIPPIADSLRVNAALLAVVNCTQTSDSQVFLYCHGGAPTPGCILGRGPSVTPPGDITIPATQPDGALWRDSPNTPLQSFLFGSMVLDDLDPSPIKEWPLMAGRQLRPDDLIPLGTTAITFGAEDAEGFTASATSNVTVALNEPRLTYVVDAQGMLSSELFLDLRFLNVGGGPARNIRLNQVSTVTVEGTGSVAYRTALYLTSQQQDLPLAIEPLSVSASTHRIRLIFDVPKSVAVFSVVENLTMDDAAGTTRSFPLAQAVIPNP